MDDALERLLLRQEIEDFLHLEAELLDARRYDDWLALLAEDVKVFMPLARNVATEALADEYTAEDADVAWLDEGIETLRQRVKQLATGAHWAEEPPSRTTHMISNLRVLSAAPGAEGVLEVETDCRFLLYRNRNEDEQDFFVGKRRDRLRRGAHGWRLCRREIRLDQNVMLAKNISVFF